MTQSQYVNMMTSSKQQIFNNLEWIFHYAYYIIIGNVMNEDYGDNRKLLSSGG